MQRCLSSLCGGEKLSQPRRRESKGETQTSCPHHGLTDGVTGVLLDPQGGPLGPPLLAELIKSTADPRNTSVVQILYLVN